MQKIKNWMNCFTWHTCWHHWSWKLSPTILLYTLKKFVTVTWSSFRTLAAQSYRRKVQFTLSTTLRLREVHPWFPICWIGLLFFFKWFRLSVHGKDFRLEYRGCHTSFDKMFEDRVMYAWLMEIVARPVQLWNKWLKSYNKEEGINWSGNVSVRMSRSCRRSSNFQCLHPPMLKSNPCLSARTFLPWAQCEGIWKQFSQVNWM